MTSPVGFRPARAQDAPALQALFEAAYSEYVPVIGRRPAPMDAPVASDIDAGLAWALDVGDRIAAALIAGPRGDHVYIANVAVAPDQRGRGLGAAALAHADRLARENGLAAIELFTNKLMAANIALYQAKGFRIVEERREDGFDRVYFRKDL